MVEDFETRLEVATERTEDGSRILHDVANSDDQTEVPTTSGNLPSIAKLFSDKNTEVDTSANNLLTQATSEADRAETAANSAQEISDLLTVNESIGLNSPENISWDVDIPCNEGIEMEEGYGITDSNGNQSVEFYRSSTTGNINKSSQSETLGTSHPMIGEDGLGVFSPFTSILLHNNDVSDAVWAKGGVFFSQNFFREGGLNEQHFIQQAFDTTSGEKYCFQCKVRSKGKQYILLHALAALNGAQAVFDLVNGEIFSTSGDVIAGMEKVDGDYYLISIIADGTGQPFGEFKISLMDITGHLQTYKGDGVSGVDIKDIMLSNTGWLAPYIETTTSQVNRADDNPSIPALNNMPKEGDDFTIMVDASVNTNIITGSTAPIFRLGASAVVLARRSQNDDFVKFEMSDKEQNLQSIHTPDVDNKPHRYVFRYKDGKMSAWVDGIVGGTSPQPFHPDYNLSEALFIGRHPTFNSSMIQGYIKNFRIISKGLSDEQIKALGSAR